MNALSRDEIVEKGLEARAVSMASEKQKGPWIYQAKVKSGRRATRNINREYTNIPDMMGDLVSRHAEEHQPLYIYGIHRVMKASLRSQREDI